MLLAKLIKVWLVKERSPGIFCAKGKKKKSTRKLLRKFYKPGLIYGTMG